MSPVQPFKLLASQRQSVISVISPVLTEANESTLSRVPETMDAFLETKFGLRLTFSRQGSDGEPKYRVSLIQLDSDKDFTRPKTLDSDHDISKDDQPPRGKDVPTAISNLYPRRVRPYRLSPDWGTSFLWRDEYDWHDPEEDDDYHVDDDVIEDRYATFYPSFESWREVYETSFEAQECHLSSGPPVFADDRVRIGWILEGLLLGCWLALQEDVKSVSYKPESKEYLLLKDPESDQGLLGFDTLIRRLLGDMQDILDEGLNQPLYANVEKVKSD